MVKKYITIFKSDGIGSFFYDHNKEVLKMNGQHARRTDTYSLFKLLHEKIRECKERGIDYKVNQLKDD
jgi:hypothetical protein